MNLPELRSSTASNLSRNGSEQRYRRPRLTLIWNDAATTGCLIGFDFYLFQLIFPSAPAAALWGMHTGLCLDEASIGFLRSAAFNALRAHVTSWSLSPHSRRKDRDVEKKTGFWKRNCLEAIKTSEDRWSRTRHGFFSRGSVRRLLDLPKWKHVKRRWWAKSNKQNVRTDTEFLHHTNITVILDGKRWNPTKISLPASGFYVLSARADW